MPSRRLLAHNSTAVHTLKTKKMYPLRRGRKSGGVTVLVRKSLKQFFTCVECDYDNMIYFKLSKDRVGTEIHCLSHCMCHHIKALTINNATQTVASIFWKISSWVCVKMETLHI